MCIIYVIEVTIARGLILAPLMLRPAPSLVHTSLHHCQHNEQCLLGYSYEAKWLPGGSALGRVALNMQCVGPNFSTTSVTNYYDPRVHKN